MSTVHSIPCLACGRPIVRPGYPSRPRKYCSWECVRYGKRVASWEGMSPRTRARRLKEAGLVKELRDRSFDQSFFEVWTPELAWVLGLIWSDGYIHPRTGQ